MSDLLPCPFCGGTPELVLQEKWKLGDLYTIRCCKIDDFSAWTTLDEIVAAWNRRTPDPLLDASLRAREATMPDARGMVPVRKGE